MKKYLAAGLIAACALATAADWQFIVRNTSGSSYSIEPSTLVRSGDTRRIWVLVSYGETKRNGTRSYKAMTEFDCRERRRRDLQTLYYDAVDGGGSNISRSGVEEWEYVVPDSVGEDMLKAVCGLR